MSSEKPLTRREIETLVATVDKALDQLHRPENYGWAAAVFHRRHPDWLPAKISIILGNRQPPDPDAPISEAQVRNWLTARLGERLVEPRNKAPLIVGLPIEIGNRV
jgi:hypothetical protein